ncbi:MAG: type III pantothenate kinase [bacterium]|nr:type III pantothenate kinase [bacterium]
MLLAVDIGNTNIVVGLFSKDKLIQKWRISTDINRTEDEYSLVIRSLLKDTRIENAIFSSVVPDLDNTFKKLIQKYYRITPLMVCYKMNLGIRIKYSRPEEIGADRLVNAAAVAQAYPLPAVIIDFGTATTFCYLDKKKQYYGGLILPGIPLMLKALHLGTAKLPMVEIKETDFIIGKSTVESIQSGVFHQTVGAINYIVDLIRKKYSKKAGVILTGGLGKLFCGHIKGRSMMDPDLTLNGLNIIHGLNR